MSTFLEWLLTRLIGKPIRVVGNGESYFRCPICNGRKFHTFPLKKSFKHRAMCWNCPFRGDSFDMLKEFHPGDTWDERRERHKELVREFEAAGGNTSSEFSFPRGHRGARKETPEERLAAAMSEVLALFKEKPPKWLKGSRRLDVLRTLVLAADIAYQHKITMERLAGAVAKYVAAAKAKRTKRKVT